jgi:NAD(P)H-hydrate repair Nnr-like enzyme with NAD(P)H-hydrate dehydratase domain
MVPPMLEHFHKGGLQAAVQIQKREAHIHSGLLGRVAVIGGSEDYTGAPYFSAMASAKLGCDMVRSLLPLSQ